MNAAHVDGAVAVATLAMLSAMIMIGQGFLYRPGRASLLWSLMFVLVMLSSFGLLIAQTVDIPWLDEFAAGFALGAPALVWSGLRAARGAPSRAWVGPTISTVAAVCLAFTVGSRWHALAYAVAYLLGAVWGALSVVEMFRRPERAGGRLIPLVLISGTLPIIGVAAMVAAVVEVVTHTSGSAIPDLKSIGTIAYLTCALVTLLSLARNPDATVLSEGTDSFPTVAAERLARAAAHDEPWSLLAISLDDTDALHAAGGEDAFRHIVDRLAAEVRATFPSSADIGADPPAGFLVLLPHPDPTIRECVRHLLDRVSTVAGDQPLSVEFSASIGWADVRTSGYDLTVLTEAARGAMRRARAEGGHRFRRAGH